MTKRKDNLRHLDRAQDSAVSAADRTGLVAAAPATEAEREAYARMMEQDTGVRYEQTAQSHEKQ